jgi:hypothetical protein
MDRNQAIARSIEEASSARGLRASADQWRDALARWHATAPDGKDLARPERCVIGQIARANE